MSAAGYPDYQRITQWFGAPLAQATAFAIGAGLKVEGPFEATNFASIVVCVKPTGGNVTVTVIQSIPGGPPALSVQTSFVVNDGNTIFEAFVLEAGSVEVHFQGAAGGETITYAIVPANTNTNAEVAALTQLGFQHNDLLAANETAIDLEDSGQFVWTLTDDPANLRMKVALALAANGAATGSLYRYTGAAWAPTAGIIADDTARKFTFGGDTTLYRAAAGQLKTDGLLIAGGQVYSQPVGAAGGFVYNPGAAGGQPLNVTVQGEANPRFYMDINGAMQWGAGGASAVDTNLYRWSAARLNTDSSLQITANTSSALILTASGSGLTMGGDTDLYRSAASQLKTDGSVVIGGHDGSNVALYLSSGLIDITRAVAGQLAIQARVSGDSNQRWSIDDAGTQQWGSGAALVDTNLYRSAAGVLKTDGKLIVGADYVLRGVDAATQFKVASGSMTGTTTGAGELAISFGITFAAAPVVVACNGDSAAIAWGANPGVKQSTVSTTGFTMSTGLATQAVRVNWIAYGAA